MCVLCVCGTCHAERTPIAGRVKPCCLSLAILYYCIHSQTHKQTNKQGEARSDLHTLPTASRLDVIRSLFGPDLAASLLPLQLTGGSGDTSEHVTLDGPMGFVISNGYLSNVTYVGRRSTLVLFINGRPVEQGQLRRAIEAVYTAQNPKVFEG